MSRVKIRYLPPVDSFGPAKRKPLSVRWSKLDQRAYDERKHSDDWYCWVPKSILRKVHVDHKSSMKGIGISCLPENGPREPWHKDWERKGFSMMKWKGSVKELLDNPRLCSLCRNRVDKHVSKSSIT